MTEIVITREFNASKTALFEASTKSEHLSHWWGGGAITVEQFEFQPEGKFGYSITNAESGVKSYYVFVFKSISDDKVDFVSGFADENFNFIRASFCPTFPLQIMNSWTFGENEDGKAVLTIRRTLFNGTSEETDFFNDVLPSMQNMLYGSSFEKLDAYLLTM